MDKYIRLIKACQEFVKGWSRFCDHINFGESNLDAESIRFMNEVPGDIKDCLDDIEKA